MSSGSDVRINNTERRKEDVRMEIGSRLSCLNARIEITFVRLRKLSVEGKSKSMHYHQSIYTEVAMGCTRHKYEISYILLIFTLMEMPKRRGNK